MPNDDELARQVRKLAVSHAETRWLALRLDEDVKEVREELRSVRATQHEHTARFDTIDETLAGHSARFGAIGETLTGHSARFGAIDDTLAEHSARFGAIDERLTEHTARFSSVDGQLRSLTQLVGQVLDRLPEERGGAGS